MKSENSQKNIVNTDSVQGNKNLNECLNNLKSILGSSKLSENILQKCLLIE